MGRDPTVVEAVLLDKKQDVRKRVIETRGHEFHQDLITGEEGTPRTKHRAAAKAVESSLRRQVEKLHGGGVTNQ